MSRRPSAVLRPFALVCAVLTALVIAACGGSGTTAVHASGSVDGHKVADLYGSLPTSGTPTGSGTITMGQLNGDQPNYILPIIPDAYATDGTAFMIDQLYVPLYSLQVGGELKVNYPTSAAVKPTFSDGNKRVTIHLRKQLKWSDGQPVTANDVLFDLALLKAAVKTSAANWEQYTPGLIPDNVASATAPNASTVVLTFKRAYNPQYLIGNELANTLYPLPATKWDVASAHGPHLNWRVPANAAKIYTYLNNAAKSPATFASDSLWKTTDGPFSLTQFSPVNSSFTLAANKGYDLDGTVRYSTLRVETYTSSTSQLNALRAGDLDVGVVDFSQLGQVPELHSAGFSVYGYPNIGTFGAILNFKDTTGHFNSIISQLYARQALDHLVDQPAYISGIFKGAAAPAYGPLPTEPRTPFTPASAGTDPYPYSVSAAAKLLRAHGWKVVPNGQTTCVKAGTGPDDCGAGIPAGTPFKFNWWATPASETESIPLESEAFASAAKKDGIEIAIGTKTFNYQISNYDDANPSNANQDNSWAVANWGEFGTTPYPTEDTIFNTSGSQDMGGYSSATANRLIHDAVYSDKSAAATKVADYLAKSLPVLFLPCADVLDAVSSKIGGTDDSFLALTQDAFYPQFWYVKKS